MSPTTFQFKFLTLAASLTLATGAVSAQPEIQTNNASTTTAGVVPATGNNWAAKEELAESTFIAADYTEAEKLWLAAISLAEAGDPLNLAESLTQITHLYLKQHRLEEARANLTKALAIRVQKLGVENPKTNETRGNLALIEHKSGNDAEAEKLYKTNLEIKRKLGDRHALTVTLTNLANFYTDQKKIEAAKELYLEALEIDRKDFGETNKETAQDLFNIGAMYYQHNYNKEALSYFDQAEAINVKLGDVPGIIRCYHYAGLCYAEMNDHASAITAYKKALALHSKLKGDKHPDTFVHQLNLARSLDSTGSIDEAEQLYKSAVVAANENHRDAKIKVVECTLEYTHFLRRHNRKEEAETLLKGLLPTYETLSSADRRMLYELPRSYSDLLKELKKESAADTMARKHLDVFGPSTTTHQ